MTRARFSAVKKEKNASIILRRPKIARITHARVVIGSPFSFPELRSSWPAPRIESLEPELSIRGAGQEDRSSENENEAAQARFTTDSR